MLISLFLTASNRNLSSKSLSRKARASLADSNTSSYELMLSPYESLFISVYSAGNTYWCYNDFVQVVLVKKQKLDQITFLCLGVDSPQITISIFPK